MAFIDRILPAPVSGGFAMEDYWVWCGSVIRGEDGLFHMFAARWPKRYPFFNGYIAYSEVVRAVAEIPEGPYSFREVVLPARGPGYWDGRMTHNPTIHRAGDVYLLFYIGSSYSGSDPRPEELQQPSPAVCRECYPNIRIGLATAKSVEGPWERPEAPILLPRPGKWDSTVITNPAPCVLSDGSILLYYRSNTPEGLRIGVAKAETFTGPFYRLQDDPVLAFEEGNHVEDPYVWWAGDHFELLAKDMTGGICGEKHAGIHALSTDGLRWEVSDPPLAYSRRVLWDNGQVEVQGCLERPQLLIEDGTPTHLYAATADGPGGFRSATRTWNMVLPLRR